MISFLPFIFVPRQRKVGILPFMPAARKSFRVMVGPDLWTIIIRKPDSGTDLQFDEKKRRLYLDPSKLRSRGIEYMAEAVLRVRFRHFITPAAAKDAGKVVSRGYRRLLSRSRLKTE